MCQRSGRTHIRDIILYHTKKIGLTIGGIISIPLCNLHIYGGVCMKRLLLLILVVALALPVFARGAAEQSSDVKTTNKGTLVVAMQADARSLDPHATNDQPSARVMKQIYETLMHQSEELDISLVLAIGYEVVSPTEYVFTLKQGVKFHNGEELTAHDVKYTFERMRQVNAPGRFLVDALDRVEVVDNYTAKMVLKFPFGPF